MGMDIGQHGLKILPIAPYQDKMVGDSIVILRWQEADRHETEGDDHVVECRWVPCNTHLIASLRQRSTRMMRYQSHWLVFVGIACVLCGCEYAGLLRPSVLKQLNPDVARLLDELPEVDAPNKAIIARLFAHGGLSHAEVGADGVMRDT